MKQVRVFIYIFLIILIGCSGSKQSGAPVPAASEAGAKKSEQKFYSLTLEQVDGSSALAFETLKGRLVLVNCWASWPVPCQEEAADLKRIYAEFKNSPFTLVSINFDEKESPDIRTFVSKNDISYPVYSGTAQCIELFPLVKEQLPSTYLAGPDGKIIKEFKGRQTYDTLKKAILDSMK